MLIGYGRVSTADQNPAHQIDALRRAGVDPDRIYLDTASGAKASRPKWDLVRTLLRRGDTLVITRLDRLGRSMLHLVTLGAELREEGIGLKVLEQGIDTDTAEGRAMFGMLSVLAEFQRELIVANTRDGLAAARARGRTGGRRPKLTPAQVRQAQRLYDEGEHTVEQIAALFSVKRATLYGHLDKTTVGTRPRAAKNTRPPGAVATAPAPTTTATEPEVRRPVRARITGPGSQPDPELIRRLERQRLSMTATRCPTCGHEPAAARDRWRQRQDLAFTWLYPDPDQPDQVIERRHCLQCQPHQDVAGIECAICGDGPLLAETTADTTEPPEPVRGWLTNHSWHQDSVLGWICGDHH